MTNLYATTPADQPTYLPIKIRFHEYWVSHLVAIRRSANLSPVAGGRHIYRNFHCYISRQNTSRSQNLHVSYVFYPFKLLRGGLYFKFGEFVGLGLASMTLIIFSLIISCPVFSHYLGSMNPLYSNHRRNFPYAQPAGGGLLYGGEYRALGSPEITRSEFQLSLATPSIYPKRISIPWSKRCLSLQ